MRRGDGDRLQRRAKLLAPFGITMMGILVDEMLRGVRVLAADPSADPERIAVSGMSLGGNATWYAAACAPWVCAAAPVCGGLGSLRRAIGEGNTDRHSPYFYIPHMLRYFDHPAIVRTCIAPRPLLLIAPRQDQDMPASGVDELVHEIAPVYEEAGVPERFLAHRPDGHHEYTREYFELVAQWLGEHL